MIELNESNIVDYLRKNKNLSIKLGNCIKVSEQYGGVASYVFRIETGGNMYYLKQSRACWRKYPEIKADQKRIKYEYGALKMIEKIHMEKLGKSLVPHVYFYDEENNTILMSDVKLRGKLLSKELAKGLTNIEVAKNVGKLLGVLHSATYGSKESIRPCNGDYRIEKENYKLRCLDVCDNVNKRVKKEMTLINIPKNKSLIYGNVCPKNIYVDRNGTVRFFDFDIARFGDPAMDVAYPIAHYILFAINNQSYRRKIKKAIDGVIRSYRYCMKKEVPSSEIGSILNKCKKYVAGVLLYRVDGVSKESCIKESRKKEIRDFASMLVLDKISLQDF